MTIRHRLNPDDNRRRIEFSNWFIERCRDHRFLANLIIGDEASFRMNGEVNTQNVREYAPWGNAPNFYYDRNDSRAKITVWVGALTSPFFYEGNVSGENLLNEAVFPQLAEMCGDQFENGTFQRLCQAQDGAPGHRAREVRNWLLELVAKAKNYYRSRCSATKSNACAKI